MCYGRAVDNGGYSFMSMCNSPGARRLIDEPARRSDQMTRGCRAEGARCLTHGDNRFRV